MNIVQKLSIVLVTSFILAACASGASGDSEPRTTTPAGSTVDVNQASTATQPKDAAATGDKIEIDYSCESDAQCAIKDIGSCCGYRPACVNVNSPTDPDGVQAACAGEGRSGVCGFPSISACQCVDQRCSAVNGPGVLPNPPNDNKRPIIRNPQGDK